VQEVSRRVWGLRLRRTVQGLALSPLAILPSAPGHVVGVPIGNFRNSIPIPPIPLSMLRWVPCGNSARLGAEWIAGPFSWSSFISYFLPVYPGAHPESLCPMSALPSLERREPSLRRALPLLPRSYGLMRQSRHLSPASALASLAESSQVAISPCCSRDLLDVILRIFPPMPEPLPRRFH